MNDKTSKKSGGGRPKLPSNKKRVIIRPTLPPFLVEKMKTYVEEKGITMSELIEMAIRAELIRDFMEPVEDVVEPEIHWLQSFGGVAAGAQAPTDAPRKQIRVERSFPDDHYALHVFGDSMWPSIHDRSTIVVRRLKEGTHPKKGEIVVYSDGHGLTLKQFGYRKAKKDEESNSFGKVVTLESLNKAYPEVETMDGGRIEAVYVKTL